MKKIVKVNKDVIDVDAVPETGIVASVYRNHVTVLKQVESTFSDSKYGKSHKWHFADINNNCMHSASSTKKEAIEKHFFDYKCEITDKYELYYFETLAEFCEAVVKNGWE